MRFIRYAAIAVVLSFLPAIGAKELIEYSGRLAARKVIASAQVVAKEPDALAVELTRLVHIAYRNTDPQTEVPFLWRLRPYLTHDLLPEFLRVKSGALDAIYFEGQCDGAARTLQFLLNEANLTADQFNIVRQSDSGHAVTIVEFSDGREAMLDPLFGVVPEQNGRLLSPIEARKLVSEGVPADQIWKKLAPTSDEGFYSRFDTAVFARQGAGLDIESVITLDKTGSLILGEPDGKIGDVIRDGELHGLTAYWHYIGNRYDRGWRRIFNFAQDTRMIIGLMAHPDERFITTEKRPKIHDNELIYEMAAGESLRFNDGDARRDWIRLRSYQDVDYIRFEAK